MTEQETSELVPEEHRMPVEVMLSRLRERLTFYLQAVKSPLMPKFSEPSFLAEAELFDNVITYILLAECGRERPVLVQGKRGEC